MMEFIKLVKCETICGRWKRKLTLKRTGKENLQNGGHKNTPTTERTLRINSIHSGNRVHIELGLVGVGQFTSPRTRTTSNHFLSTAPIAKKHMLNIFCEN